MAFPTNHWLLALSGPHYVDERWSMNLRLNDVPGFSDEAESQALCQAFATALQGWWPTNPLIGSQSKLDTVKMNEIKPDGKYLHGFTSEVRLSTPASQTNPSTMPPQVAIVATLTTGVARGLANRGRIFLPAPRYTIDQNTGLLTGPSVTALGNGVAGLIDLLNGVQAGMRVVVASDVREGAQRPVTGVEIGRVFDTLRSRRRSLLEVRAPFSVTAPA